MANIVQELFPQQSPLQIFQHTIALLPIPPVTANELLNAVNRVNVNKTPGLDGMQDKILKIAAQKRIDILCELFKNQDGVLPEPSYQKQINHRKYHLPIDPFVC